MKRTESSEPIKESNESKKSKSFDVFLLINYSLEKKDKEINEEIKFVEKDAKIIFSEKDEKETIVEYRVVIQYKLKNPKKKNINLEFKIGDIDYSIDFENKNLHFIYHLDLTIIRHFIHSNMKIKQTMDDTQKFILFYDSIKQFEQESLYDDLYLDTINLYSSCPKFELLVNIFIKVFNKKEACTNLIEKFKAFNRDLVDSVKKKKICQNFRLFILKNI